jgi:hypothetical protein
VKVLPESASRGLQLFIDHVTENSEYTCGVTTAAEKRERVIKVRVLLPNDPVCSPESFKGVQWGLTLADTDNEQPCLHNMSGTARRRCSQNVNWLEPDFSDCISHRIMVIKTVVDGMLVGFGSQSVDVFRKTARDLYDFVVKQRPLLRRGIFYLL